MPSLGVCVSVQRVRVRWCGPYPLVFSGVWVVQYIWKVQKGRRGRCEVMITRRQKGFVGWGTVHESYVVDRTGGKGARCE